MAKRKRPTLQTASRKRAKESSPPRPHPHGNFDPEREYKLKSIVGESGTEYLIRWEDDEETGEKFADSWEPKANANSEAIADWKKQKADKKRLERLSRQASGSRSNTPQPGTPRKTAAASRKTGRPRNVIESSQSAAEAPHTNGDHDQPQQPVDDLLEIGESQHTETSPQQEAGAPKPGPDSPLFVPPESPTAIESPNPSLAAVQVADPPSSYFAGAYEPVSSSQAAPSTNPPAKASPEPSQYVPDPADTSKATDDTTEVSLAPTTPSEQTRSVPVNFGHSSTTKIVPDSQSLLGSSSYVPSATTTTSSSVPEARQQTGLSSEHSLAPSGEQEGLVAPQATANIPQPETEDHLSEQVAEEQVEVQIEHAPQSTEDVAPWRGEDAQALNTGLIEDRIELPVSIDGAVSPQRSQEVQGSFQGPEVSAEGVVQQSISKSNERSQQGVPGEEPTNEGELADRTRSPSSPIQTVTGAERQEEQPQPVPSQSLSISREATPPKPSSSLQPTSAQPQINHAESSNGSSASDRHRSEARTESAHPDSSTQSGTRQPGRSQVTDQAGQSIEPVIPQDEPLSVQDQLPSESQSREVAANVDLTALTQDHPTSISRFSPTPPSLRAIRPVQHHLGPQRLNCSDWQSSGFPFETQISRPRSAGSAFPVFLLGRSDLQSQLPSLSHSQLSRLSVTTPRAQSVPLRQSSPVLVSSPIPQPPSESIGLGIIGESAPLRLKTPSSPLRPPSVTSKMSTSQPSSGSERVKFAAKMKAMRENTRRISALQRGETPTSAPTCDSSELPANTQPPSSAEPSVQPVIVASQAPVTVTEPSPAPAPAIPARLKSPLLLAQDGRRSPSAVPHLEPLPIITQDEMNNSERYETLLPQAQDYGGDDKQRNGSLVATGTPSREPNGTVDSETTNLYTIPISMSGHQRDQYPNTVYYHRATIEQFLATDNPDAELVAKAKHFVDRTRYITMHPDLDNPETLTQFDVEPSQQADWDVSCSAKFRFLKELFDSLRTETLHIVIVASPGRIVDILETFLQGIRVAYQRPGAKQMAKTSTEGNIRATLLDTNAEASSADTADLVIAMDNFVRHDSQYIRALRQKGAKWAPFVSLVVPCTVEHVERCISPDLSDRAASRALISGIYQYTKGAGRLEDGQQPPKDTASALAHFIRNIDRGLEWPLAPLSALQDLGSQIESEIEPMAADGKGIGAPRTGEKRSREPDDVTNNEAHQSKTARIAHPVAEEAEITHISDSLDKSTQPDDAGTEVGEALLGLTDTEKRLQELLSTTQGRLDEHVQALSDLQYRFEEQRNQLIEVTNERDRAISTAQQAAARFNEQSNSVSRYRASQNELEMQLREMRERLLNHTIPERAELESVRLGAEMANAEKIKLDQRLQQAQKDAEYARGLYQESSTQATRLATQTTELQNQLAVVQNKATGEQARLRQMGYDNFTKKLQEENKKLKSIVNNREAALKFRDEEIAKLKEASRGRMGTRGTSVPRSPRIGSPRMGSRQTSPAAGDLRGKGGLLHPLRNA